MQLKKNSIFFLFFLLVCRVSVYSEFSEAKEIREVSATIQKLTPYLQARTVSIKVSLGAKAAYGSGGIISEDGIVLTCAHVSEIADILTVVTSDGKEYPAKKLGTNSIHDYSLLKIDGRNLPYFKLGKSSDLKILQWVVALGHPGGPYPDNQPAVNAGRIRALHKKMPIFLGWKFYDDAIQTDAPIFAGNSGGPLVDLEGNLIGVNGAIILANDLTFSIPIDKIKKDLPMLKKGRNVEGKIPGIYELYHILQDLQEDVSPEDMQKMFKDTPLGKMLKLLGSDMYGQTTPKSELGLSILDIEDKIYVTAVDTKGVGALAGFQVQDRILAVDGKKRKAAEEVEDLFNEAQKEDEMVVTISRKGKELDLLLAFDKRAYSRERCLQRAFAPQGKALKDFTVKIFSGNKLVGFGVIVSTEGHILTSLYHGKDLSSFVVQIQSDKDLLYRPQWVGSHGAYALALWKIKSPNTLKAIRFGSIQDVKIGQWVISGADDKGILQAGMVSALGRVVPQHRKVPTLGLFGLLGTPNKSALRAYPEVIQHDTNIESEHFGTPLVNEEAALIGINVGHFYRGTVFATPILLIEEALPIMMEGKDIATPAKYQPYQPELDPYSQLFEYFLNPEQRKEGLEEVMKNLWKDWQPKSKAILGVQVTDHEKGVEVVEVLEGYGAAKAGVQREDIIIEIDKQKIDSVVSLLKRVQKYSPGDQVTLLVLRPTDGRYEEKEFLITLDSAN